MIRPSAHVPLCGRCGPETEQHPAGRGRARFAADQRRERSSTCAAAAVPAEADERSNPCSDDQQHGQADPALAAACPLTRLLEQRLQIRNTLFEIAILLDLWPAGGGVVTVTATPFG